MISEVDEEKGREEKSSMHELGRKSLGSGYFNNEVYKEMSERNIVEETIFGPKINQEDTRKNISYKDSVELFMKSVEEKRKNELYPHLEQDCSEDCKKRGCGNVSVVDGNWKLTHKICMWNPKSRHPTQNILKTYPNVCSEQPAYGSAFCVEHSRTVEDLGYPSELRKFLEKCGANPNSYNKEGKAKVSAILDKLTEQSTNQENTASASDAQGTTYFLRNRQLANRENFSLREDAESDCRKDIGEVQVFPPHHPNHPPHPLHCFTISPSRYYKLVKKLNFQTFRAYF